MGGVGTRAGWRDTDRDRQEANPGIKISKLKVDLEKD